MRIPTAGELLPEDLVTLAAEFSDGTREPAAPRDAATVVLLRPDATGTGSQLYLLRRQTSMEFAGGMAVFPGGGVDRRDFDTSVSWSGPSPAEWADRLGTDEELARALVCAAVRETFEESGVLLAGASPETVVSDTTGADWEADRVALESRELAMTDFLNRRGLVLRTELLGVWDAWLTPAFEPRRFRTWFFVALLPEGQTTRDVSTESSSVRWADARAAVAAVDAGELAMLPPTYLNCLEIAEVGPPSAVLAAAEGRRVAMFTPSPEEVAGGYALSMPERHRPLLERHR